MFRQKAKNVTRLARELVERHGGEVPRTLEALVTLPGVGRKTGNVVLGVAFGLAEGVVVDTHVQRLAQRLGWTRHATPDQIELDLLRMFPQGDWPMLSHTLIFHGRRICTARSPQCLGCPIASRCPNAFKAENVGRKHPKPRRAATVTARSVSQPKAAVVARKKARRPKPAAVARKKGRSGAATVARRPRASS
jgi:endonuclease-3